ncbi:MAG TPA: nitrilase family protein, partial [Bacteroidales bacterium]|nr:nitrilase family protein [Bacteroidales bacterium]
KGEKLVDTKQNKEEIVYSTIDRNLLYSFRNSFPVAKDWDKISLI